MRCDCRLNRWERPETSDRLLLDGGQLPNARASQFEHGGKLLIAESGLFARALDLDEPARTGHHHIHIDGGGEILLVT